MDFDKEPTEFGHDIWSINLNRQELKDVRRAQAAGNLLRIQELGQTAGHSAVAAGIRPNDALKSPLYPMGFSLDTVYGFLEGIHEAREGVTQ